VIAAIISLISGLFSAAGKLFDFLYARQMVDVGKTQAKLEQLSKQVQDAKIAVAARESVRADIATNGDRVPDDDPFLRD